MIPRAKLKGGKQGDKAIVRITSWPEDDKNPLGEVVDILGKTGENTTEMHAILAEFGLPYRYPENVDKAAQKIDAGITPEEVAARIDMRDVLTFTIDPRDAKDFDDALSIRKLSDGNYEVGVHIADVTHYVHPRSISKKEKEFSSNFCKEYNLNSSSHPQPPRRVAVYPLPESIPTKVSGNCSGRPSSPCARKLKT